MIPRGLHSKAPFLIFIGPDGSGKSTQVRWFANKFRSDGLRTKTVWIRNFHFPFAYLLSRLFVSTGYVEKHENYVERMSMYSIVLLPRLGNLWAWIEFASIIPHVLFQVLFPRLLGYAIVSDRCTIDSIVAVSYAIRDPAYINSLSARMLLAMVPRDALTVYLRTEPRVLGERRLMEEENIEFLTYQLWAYDKITNRTRAVIVDTGLTKAPEVSNIVLKALSSNGYSHEK